MKIEFQMKIEGRVIPERRSVSLPKLGPISYVDTRGFEAVIDFSIQSSIVLINVCGEMIRDLPLSMPVVRAYEVVTCAVDLFAFDKGWSLAVILDDMIIDGERVGLALSEESVSAYSTEINTDIEYKALFDIVMKDFNLKFALRDLVSSLSTLNYSEIAAARSVEAIRQSIAPDARSDSEAWEVLRTKLRIDRSYIQFITDASRQPRHGQRGSSFGVQQMESTHRAWRILNRYLIFKKKGGKIDLPSSEFPLLKSE